MILIYLVVGWAVGIFAAYLLHLPTPIWLGLLVLPLGYLLLFWRDALLRKWHIVLVFFILGALRYQLGLPAEINQELAQFNQQGRSSLIGVVVNEPDVRDTQTLVTVDATKIQIDGAWRETHGLALVSVPRDTPVNYGDEVQVDGAPETPPDDADFSYRDYLARQNIFTLIRNARLYTISSGKGLRIWTMLYAFKDSAEQAVNRLLPEPSAALLNGILLGDARGIPTELRAAFNNTNTAHIIAISGFNITIVIAVLVFVFRKPANVIHARALTMPHGARRRIITFATQHLVTVLILAFLVLYTLMVGASASVVRACIMGALLVIAFDVQRQSWALNALAIAVLVMSLLNPYVLWDVGFQLSAVATLGLLLYVPRMQNWIQARLTPRVGAARARSILDFLQDAILVTAAAFLVTEPLIILYFHRFSLIGFLTNFLILPVQPAIMLLGGAATLLQLLANAMNPIPLVGLIPAALAQVLAWGAYVCLQYTILVVQWTAAIPFGSFDVPRIDVPLVILFYALLLVMTGLGVKRAVGVLFARVWIPIAALALASIFVWTTALAAPDPRMRITFIAADRGDATLIQTAQDERILINGTGEPSAVLSYLGTQLPPWDRRIDMVIATHVDDANLSSLNGVLERYDVGKILEPNTSVQSGVSYAKWRELISQKGIETVATEQGTTLQAGEVGMEVVYPTNDDSPKNGLRRTTDVGLRVDANGETFLFAPGLNTLDRAQMVKDGTLFDADVLVLGNEVEKRFMDGVMPETVVLFVGTGAREQPTAETMKALEGAAVVRTDEKGTITYFLDGGQVKIETYK